MTDLSQDELVSLFILLTQHEETLDTTMQKLRTRIERKLYELLSIEELENLVGPCAPGKPGE